MKFAFVSQTVPPSWSGQSVMIHRLLRDLDPDDYCLVAQDYGGRGPHGERTGKRLPGAHYRLPASLQIKRGWRFDAVKWANVFSRALQIARIVRREGCGAVVATTGDPFDMPAAYVAARLTRAKFYAYLFDYYSHKAVGRGRGFARRVEPVVLKGAVGVIVPNEVLRDDLRRRYGIEPKVIYNPCDLSDYESLPPAGESFGAGGEVRIVYTGSIYEAHYGAFRDLAAGLRLLRRRDVRLHLYTDQSPEELGRQGIYEEGGPVVLHGPRAVSDVPAIQRQADLLFLPLAFDSPYPEIIRSSAPGKTGEYLAAGRPVLVHAPPDSFLALYFRRHGCGLVADEPGAEKLAAAVESLVGDAQLRRRLTAGARERARADFSVEASRNAFMELLGIGPSGSREKNLRGAGRAARADLLG